MLTILTYFTNLIKTLFKLKVKNLSNIYLRDYFYRIKIRNI